MVQPVPWAISVAPVVVPARFDVAQGKLVAFPQVKFVGGGGTQVMYAVQPGLSAPLPSVVQTKVRHVPDEVTTPGLVVWLYVPNNGDPVFGPS